MEGVQVVAEERAGTAEEIAAVFVAALRALGLLVRFVRQATEIIPQKVPAGSFAALGAQINQKTSRSINLQNHAVRVGSQGRWEMNIHPCQPLKTRAGLMQLVS